MALTTEYPMTRLPYPTNNGTENTEDECFVEEHPAHLPGLCTDGEQDTNLLHPLVDRHHHHIEDARSSDQERDAADRKDERGHRAQG